MSSSAPVNYYAGNPLNRLSYLRSSSAFLSSALSSPKAKFLLYNKLNPLCEAKQGQDQKSAEINLKTVSWDDVKSVIGDHEQVFKDVDGKSYKQPGTVSAFWMPGGQKSDANPSADEQARTIDLSKLSNDEKRHHFINQPALVFLGVDETDAPADKKSMPDQKPDDNTTLESFSPLGVPYWALDVTTLDSIRDKHEDVAAGIEFRDLRAGMSSISAPQAAIAGLGRSLVDWNQRNKFCPACARPLRSIWAGWKRACIPSETGSSDVESPVCISKKGVHDFNYPRYNPVVIMAVASSDGESLLLGRQRTWPKAFYSCLAGFVESGESIEEAVRREVFEEAGVEVERVTYHSTQPWPFPSSLMIGCIAFAKDGQTIRTDLDNELEEAHFFTRAEVESALGGGKEWNLTRDEVQKLDRGEKFGRNDETAGEKRPFRVPPATAIAHQLIKAWAERSYVGAQPAREGSGKL